MRESSIHHSPPAVPQSCRVSVAVRPSQERVSRRDTREKRALSDSDGGLPEETVCLPARGSVTGAHDRCGAACSTTPSGVPTMSRLVRPTKRPVSTTPGI